MKIGSFNVNSIRVRLDHVLDWLATHEPDIVALQETKCEDHLFPSLAFEELGYHCEAHGMKSYNGVALLSRHPLTRVQRGLMGTQGDCRLIAADACGYRIINTYVPNGTKLGTDKWVYKLNWLETFRGYLQNELLSRTPLIWLGDVNIAPTSLDVYDSGRHLGQIGHHPDEFAKLKAIYDMGLTDSFRLLHPDERSYTFFDYVITNSLKRNLGWRIDHIACNAAALSKLETCEHHHGLREQVQPSDHVPILANFRD